ncbi:pyridoxal-phosphate dependent enzyme [Mesobacterium sp. TK19101]|uniref:Pyridoxal-phosphate dependent enzyme n=1 Tax=Mesobacterium hydrothermale TaxID=3111907 RepID=A0ABU6HF47_9RHOB|nr:pyridoxal-phosphate dependent enzyme [Mesobacterium sp. TK19101]MEC3861090.1 pyridoxal-phosphate dependent enzyme [Mesobacterium sp. TK19101]
MRRLENPWRGKGLTLDVPMPASDAGAVLALLQNCPAHTETPLVPVAGLAGVGCAWVKDERTRMGLGSFKALGAAHVIAHAAQSGPLDGITYVTASAGNHGLSVAAGARVFGARAVIYLSETVPAVFAERLRAKGAEVVRAGHDYEASMQAAAQAADENGWILLSDSSWEGYTELPHRLMEGYLAMAEEAANQLPEPPTHILLQAGVGGLAGAVAAHARARWGDGPQIIVVEPEAAPALYESIRLGEAVETTGPVSVMGRLDCKAPSLIALQGLSRDADAFVLITEAEAEEVLPALAAVDLATTASGGAGLAALIAGAVSDPNARVLTFLTEAPE